MGSRLFVRSSHLSSSAGCAANVIEYTNNESMMFPPPPPPICLFPWLYWTRALKDLPTVMGISLSPPSAHRCVWRKFSFPSHFFCPALPHNERIFQFSLRFCWWTPLFRANLNDVVLCRWKVSAFVFIALVASCCTASLRLPLPISTPALAHLSLGTRQACTIRFCLALFAYF